MRVELELVQHALRATGGHEILRLVAVERPGLDVRFERLDLGAKLIGSPVREVVRHFHLVPGGLLTHREAVDGPVVRAGPERNHLAAERVDQDLVEPVVTLPLASVCIDSPRFFSNTLRGWPFRLGCTPPTSRRRGHHHR